MNEEQIAEKLAELEPAWAGRPNFFDKHVKALFARLDDQLPGVRADAAEALGRLKEASAVAQLKAMRDADPSVRRGDELEGSAKIVPTPQKPSGSTRIPHILKAYRTEQDFVMRDQAFFSLLMRDADLRVEFSEALGLAGFEEPAGNQRLAQHLTSNN